MIKNSYILPFILLLLLVIINRFLILIQFGFEFTGSDDLIFWQMTKDYSEGIFHEPFFYGQDYNYALESIVAVPLIWLNVPYYMALPIATSLLAVFPFIFFSILLFKKKHYLNAIIFLTILLAMPIEYDMITTMTRGFVSGLFFSSFLIFPLLDSKSVRSFWILSFSVVLGFLFNPNSVIISLPVCIYLFLINYKKLSFYFIFIGVTIPLFFLDYLFKQFYVEHPEYIIHTMWRLTYSSDLLIHTLSNLESMFKYLTPVYWKGHWMSVLLIAIFGFSLLKKDWRKGISIILGILFIVASFGVNKISDSLGVIYLSSTRMFLAVPILLGVTFFWLQNNSTFWNNKNTTYIILTIGVSVFLTKISSLDNVVNAHTDKTNYGAVAIMDVNELRNECNQVEQITTENNIDLVVYIPSHFINNPQLYIYNYGCNLFNSKFPITIVNKGDRRTWIFKDIESNPRENILFFNIDTTQLDSISSSFLDYEIIGNDPTMAIIKNNTLKLDSLSSIFGFEFGRK